MTRPLSVKDAIGPKTRTIPGVLAAPAVPTTSSMVLKAGPRIALPSQGYFAGLWNYYQDRRGPDGKIAPASPGDPPAGSVADVIQTSGKAASAAIAGAGSALGGAVGSFVSPLIVPLVLLVVIALIVFMAAGRLQRT